MSALKRYAVSSDGRAFPDAQGNWVFHEDAAALRTEVARLKTELAMAEANDERRDLKAEVARLTVEAESREAEYSTALAFAQTELAALVAECDAAKADRDAMAVTMGDLLMKTVARRDFDELRADLATEKAAHAETKALYESWHKQALYLQQQHEPCEVHHGARRACGQCHDSLAQHLANEKAAHATETAAHAAACQSLELWSAEVRSLKALLTASEAAHAATREELAETQREFDKLNSVYLVEALDRAEAAESREAAMRELLPRLIQAARDGYGHAGKAGCVGCEAVAEGVAALAAVPAPDAAPTEAALMAAAERVRDACARKAPCGGVQWGPDDFRKLFSDDIDIAAIVKGEKP